MAAVDEHPFALPSTTAPLYPSTASDYVPAETSDILIVQPIIRWLEKEIKSRLIHLDEKLITCGTRLPSSDVNTATRRTSVAVHAHDNHGHDHSHRAHEHPRATHREPSKILNEFMAAATATEEHVPTAPLTQRRSSSKGEVHHVQHKVMPDRLACHFEMGPAALRKLAQARSKERAELERLEDEGIDDVAELQASNKEFESKFGIRASTDTMQYGCADSVAGVKSEKLATLNKLMRAGTAVEAEEGDYHSEEAESPNGKSDDHTWSANRRTRVVSTPSERASVATRVSTFSNQGNGRVGIAKRRTSPTMLHGQRSFADQIANMTSLPSAFNSTSLGWRERVWTFMDDPESSKEASFLALTVKVFIGLTVLVTLLQTPDPPPLRGATVQIVETVFDVIFMLEIILRIIVCPNKHNLFHTSYTWIDVAAGSVFFLRAINNFEVRTLGEEDTTEWENMSRIILLCVVPIIRLMKMLRHYEDFHLLLQAFQRASEALPVLLFVQLAMTLTAACCIFIVEPRENIQWYPQAVWLVIVTMTTVGYGDIIPVSTEGSIFVSILVVGSVLFMAIPVGIIGGAFAEVWDDRDRILLVQKTRDRLHKWGYTVKDIPIIFAIADEDGNGGVDMDEFIRLMHNLKIGLSEARVIELFDVFDADNSGYIDAEEFVKNVFPSQYADLYGSAAARKHGITDMEKLSPRFASLRGGDTSEPTSPKELMSVQNGTGDSTVEMVS